jgi:hypothetical protein
VTLAGLLKIPPACFFLLQLLWKAPEATAAAAKLLAVAQPAAVQAGGRRQYKCTTALYYAKLPMLLAFALLAYLLD